MDDSMIARLDALKMFSPYESESAGRDPRLVLVPSQMDVATGTGGDPDLVSFENEDHAIIVNWVEPAIIFHERYEPSKGSLAEQTGLVLNERVIAEADPEVRPLGLPLEKRRELYAHMAAAYRFLDGTPDRVAQPGTYLGIEGVLLAEHLAPTLVRAIEETDGGPVLAIAHPSLISPRVNPWFAESLARAYEGYGRRHADAGVEFGYVYFDPTLKVNARAFRSRHEGKRSAEDVELEIARRYGPARIDAERLGEGGVGRVLNRMYGLNPDE